jgi:hypothetical protein
MSLTIHRHTLANALRCAAEVYKIDARTASTIPGHERVERAFKDQAIEAAAIAEQIEQADMIRIED